MTKLSKNEKKQFFKGFFAVYGLWIIGILASGCIAFVEMIEFYNAPSFLAVIFSALFLTILVVSSVKCAVNGHKNFFWGMMFAAVFPMISQLIAAGIFSLTEIIGSMGGGEWILVPLTVIAFLFIAPAFPISSVSYKWATLDINKEWPVYAFIIVMALTIILPPIIYKFVKSKQRLVQ